MTRLRVPLVSVGGDYFTGAAPPKGDLFGAHLTTMPRRPTIRDVAEQAGVSRTLVSFALNNRPGVAPATKERILSVAAELGYTADPAARALRTGRTGILGLVIRNYTNPYFLDVIAGAQDVALQAGATVLAVDSAYDEATERDHVRRLAAARADALAIAPVGGGGSVAVWRDLRPNCPVVTLNAASPSDPTVMSVGPDNVAAVEASLAHLVNLGHRRIGFVQAPSAIRADPERWTRFARACETHHVAGVAINSELTIPAVRQAVGKRLDGTSPPTAIITNSDHTAHGVYFAARDRGVVIGKELSVVGHDDLPTSELLDPPLTTVALDRVALGREVAERLLRNKSGDHIEPTTLLRRRSTAPAPS